MTTSNGLGDQSQTAPRGKGAARPLTKHNALVLVDEFEALFAREHGEHTDPRARESAKRILSSLTLAPGPSDEIAASLRRILAWTELLFDDSAEAAGPGDIKTSLRRSLAELRTSIEDFEDV
jgi:hypothetical protein